MMNSIDQFTERMTRIQIVAIAVGVLGVIAGTVGALLATERFFPAYLFAFLYWSGISLGCLAFLLLHHLTGGVWGFAVQRLLEAGARTLLLMGLLFVPLLFGLSSLYPWSIPDVVAADEVLLSKSRYLNVPFFIARAALYFAIWIGIATFVTRWSYLNDESGEVALWHKVLRLSGFGLILFTLAANFATYDWLMSLEPRWFSSIFGWMAIFRHALGAIAFVVVLLAFFWQHPLLRELLDAQGRNDLGNVLLATLLSWAYMHLMQFLIIWAENIPGEVVWYVRRTEGSWLWVARSLIVLYVGLPAILLLLRPVKRRMGFLVAVAGLILVLRLVHIYWLVMPVFTPTLSIHWLDVALPLAIGGLWLAIFAWHLKRHLLVPVNHPKFQEDLSRLRQESYERA